MDLAEMSAEQRPVGSPCDEDVSRLQLQELPLTSGNGTILCDVSTPFHRPFVPPSLRRKVLSDLQNLSHPGSQNTVKLVFHSFACSGVHKEMKALTRACLGCQRSRVQRHLPYFGCTVQSCPPGHQRPLASVQWLFPSPNLRISIHPVARSYPSAQCRCFNSHQGLPQPSGCHFLNPPTTMPDRGAQFESNLFRSLLAFLGCTRIRTTTYHPAANRMVERFYCQLKASLRAAADLEN
nr:unnamed protein product [Spirometra erinaceieuropaei]